VARAIGINHVALEVGDETGGTALRAAGVEVPESRLAFHDPWGNRVEVVDCADVQVSKAPEILAAFELERLEKTDAARAELRAKGITGAR